MNTHLLLLMSFGIGAVILLERRRFGVVRHSPKILSVRWPIAWSVIPAVFLVVIGQLVVLSPGRAVAESAWDFTQLLLCVCVVFAFRQEHRATWREFGFQRIGLKSAILCVVAFAFMLPFIWVLQAAGLKLSELISTSIGPYIPKVSESPRMTTTLGWYILSAVIIAPIVEEFLFRGILYTGLRSRIGPWPAVMVSGVLFGLAHCDERVFAIMASGVLYSLFYEASGSVVVPTCLHSFGNALAVLKLLASE